MLRDLGPLPGSSTHDLGHAHLDARGQRVGDPGACAVVRDVVGTPIKAVGARDRRPGQRRAGDRLRPPTADGQPVVEGTDLLVGQVQGRGRSSSGWCPRHRVRAGRENWSVDGIVCYSKICTHVGCPISLNEQHTHHLLCPCHQSTFDLADSGKVVFGPAARPLPQLDDHRRRRGLPRRATRLRRAGRTELLGAWLIMSLDTSKIANTNSGEPAIARSRARPAPRRPGPTTGSAWPT